MPTIADYVTIRVQRPLTLPEDGDIDRDLPFNAPAVNAASRSILTFRVKATGGVKLTMLINDNKILEETFEGPDERSWHDIVPPNVLKENDNTLTLKRAAATPGQTSVSNIVLFYQANI